MKPLDLVELVITFMRPISLEYLAIFLDDDQIFLWVENDMGQRYDLKLNLIGGTGLVTFQDEIFISNFNLNNGDKMATIDDLKRISKITFGIGNWKDGQTRKLSGIRLYSTEAVFTVPIATKNIVEDFKVDYMSSFWCKIFPDFSKYKNPSAMHVIGHDGNHLYKLPFQVF